VAVGVVVDEGEVVVVVFVVEPQPETTRARERARTSANKKKTNVFERGRLVIILTSRNFANVLSQVPAVLPDK
jgi:hypothetical protein